MSKIDLSARDGKCSDVGEECMLGEGRRRKEKGRVHMSHGAGRRKEQSRQAMRCVRFYTCARETREIHFGVCSCVRSFVRWTISLGMPASIANLLVFHFVLSSWRFLKVCASRRNTRGGCPTTCPVVVVSFFGSGPSFSSPYLLPLQKASPSPYFWCIYLLPTAARAP